MISEFLRWYDMISEFLVTNKVSTTLMLYSVTTPSSSGAIMSFLLAKYQNFYRW